MEFNEYILNVLIDNEKTSIKTYAKLKEVLNV